MGFPVGSNIDLVSLLKDVPQNYEHIDPTNCRLSSTILLSVTIYARDTALLHLYFEQYYLKMRIRIAINIDMLLYVLCWHVSLYLTCACRQFVCD